MFDGAVYDRGAMTLHALRLKIGDAAFFRLMKEWVRTYAGGNVATPQFIALAEKIEELRRSRPGIGPNDCVHAGLPFSWLAPRPMGLPAQPT